MKRTQPPRLFPHSLQVFNPHESYIEAFEATLLTLLQITGRSLFSVSLLPHRWASWLKLLVICLTLTQMEMSVLFLAATRDSQQWPSYALGFLNIQLECGEVATACVCVCVSGVSVCTSVSVNVSLSARERERDYRGAANTGIMIPLI